MFYPFPKKGAKSSGTRTKCAAYVKSQPICGPLVPYFDGFCANNTTKMNFRLCAIISTGAIKLRPHLGKITVMWWSHCAMDLANFECNVKTRESQK